MLLGRTALTRDALTRSGDISATSAVQTPVPKGNTGFKWTDTSGNAQTIGFRWPPFIVDVGERKARWRHERTAHGVPETWTIGSAVGTVTLRVRIHGSGTELLDFLEDAADGVQVDYYTDLSDESTKHPSWLLEPTSPAEITQDEDRFSHGEYEMTVRLMHADGGDYRDLL